MENETYLEDSAEADTFNCTDCGADLEYEPGTEYLTCEYCGTKNEILSFDEEIEELDFIAYLREQPSEEDQITESFVKCDSCGASSTLQSNISSSNCPYCDTPLIISDAKDESIIKPKSLIPFNLSKEEAVEQFKRWVKGLWFAPSALKKATMVFEHFKGVYIPYWTYDTNTYSQYTGQRGDDYYVTERYTARVNGKSVRKSRRVKKTRWRSVRGDVNNSFDDLLIPATNSLPRKYINKLEPWPLEELVAYDKSYLSGFITEKYQIDLADGFEYAKDIAEVEIRRTIKRDIGGDHQRISRMNTRWSDISFKHLLLPVFVSAYKFKGKVYQFLVNARTGEVQGERPYSWVKILAVAIPSVIVIACVVWYIANQQQMQHY